MAARLLDQNPVYLDASGNRVAGGTLYFYVNGTTTPKDVYGDKDLSINLGASVGLDASGRVDDDIWLDGTYSVELKDADDVQVWQRDDVEAPSELPSQTGQAGRFLTSDGTNPEWEAIEQVPDYAGASAGDVLQVFGGVPIWAPPNPVEDYAGATLEEPVLLNERTTGQAVTATATTTIDYALGAVVSLAHGTSITTLNFSNFGSANEWARMVIIRTKDNSATARTINWGTVLFPGNTDPTLTQTANAVDIVELFSNGSVVYGRSLGANYS